MRLRVNSAAILFIVLAAPVFAQTNFLSVEKTRIIDSLLAAAYPDSLPGISVLIAKDGKPVYRKAFGMADMELNVKLTPENVFAIGSQTKQFTAVAILKLVQEGKISLNDDMKKYLPDYNAHGKTITIENLLTHTSGIPSYTEVKGFLDFYQRDKSPQEIIATIQDSSLLFDPSTNWSYSNTGFLLLAYIVEKVSGESYHQFVEENIFKPADMNHSYFGSYEKIIPNRAQGYDPLDSIHVQHTGYYSWTWPYGAGDILSCADDMLKWSEAMYTDKIVNQSLLQKAWTPFTLTDGRSTNYGYGLSINTVSSHKLIEHGGAIGGYLSDAIRIPDMHVYIVGLQNTTARSPQSIAGKIALLLMDQPIKDPAPISVSEKILSQYTGVFEANMEGGRVTSNYGSEKEYRYVTIDSGKLFIQRSGGEKAKLISYAADKFYIEKSTKYISFQRDPKKVVTSMLLSDYPVQYGPVEVSKKTNLLLPQPKKEITVASEILKSYCGVYELQPGLDLTVTSEGNRIYAQATGQGMTQLFAENETHFFLKEIDAQVDFNKDADGKISSLTLTQGQKYVCKKISDKTPSSDKKEISVDPKILQTYAGTYEMQPGFDITVFLKDNHFYLQATGQGANELFAESETKFFLKVVDAQVEFIKDDTGNISEMILYQSGKHECKRIK